MSTPQETQDRYDALTLLYEPIRSPCRYALISVHFTSQSVFDLIFLRIPLLLFFFLFPLHFMQVALAGA